MKAKGTIKNRELFTRHHFVKLVDVDEADFLELIDSWSIEYAELYATKAGQ